MYETEILFYTVPKPISVSSSTQRGLACQPPLYEGQWTVTRNERGQLNNTAAKLSQRGVCYFHVRWLNPLKVLWASYLTSLASGCPQDGKSPEQTDGYNKVRGLTFPHGAVKVLQSRPTLCNPVDHTVHGILQASPRYSNQHGNEPTVMNTVTIEPWRRGSLRWRAKTHQGEENPKLALSFTSLGYWSISRRQPISFLTVSNFFQASSVSTSLLKIWGIAASQCCGNKVNQLCVHTPPPSWPSVSLPPRPIPLGHHRALSWAPRATRRFPLAVCFTHGSAHTSIPIHPHLEKWYRFPGGTSGKEPACQCRRHKRWGFSSWVGEIPWRRAWQPTPVFLPGESHGQRSLVSYSPWGPNELDTTDVT